MKNHRISLLWVTAFLMTHILMAEDAKKEFVEIETIVFVKSEYQSKDMVRLIDDTFTRIRRGEDFRALAKKVSDGSVNYREHLVDTATLLQPVQNALKRLEPGETSDLIVTDKSYIIVKLIRRPKANSPRQ